MKPLSPRQQSILNRVVDVHIETAQPVGSRFITECYTQVYQDSYSSATVRNEMGRLEDWGYLTHPHPSAGRIPTDLGYRYYVDHGLRQENPSSKFLQKAHDDLSTSDSDVDALAERATDLLSEISGEVSLILVPDKFQDRWPGTARRYKLFVQGSSRILEKPEFQDIEKIKLLLKALESKLFLIRWLMDRPSSPGNSITIGRENRQEVFHDCAVVSTRYCIKGEEVGTVAILGPRRMKYSKTVPLVENMARLFSQAFDRIDPQ